MPLSSRSSCAYTLKTPTAGGRVYAFRPSRVPRGIADGPLVSSCTTYVATAYLILEWLAKAGSDLCMGSILMLLHSATVLQLPFWAVRCGSGSLYAPRKTALSYWYVLYNEFSMRY